MSLTKEQFLESVGVQAFEAGMFSIFFGVPGIGKTAMILWLAKRFKVLYIPFEGEDSASLLASKGICPEVNQLPVMKNLHDFLEAIDAICELDLDIDYVVIDTLTSLGVHYKADILANLFGGDVLKYGHYGKGNKACELHADKIVDKFLQLKNKGINVVLLAHSQNAKEENAEGLDFAKQTFLCEPALRDQIAAKADNIFRIGVDIFVDDSKGKGKASSTNQRVLYTENTATSGCKNRIGCLPRYDLGSNAESGGEVIAELLS